MFKLMIKQHNKTKLKYLCITKREDHVKYTGSGTYWKAHLRKHGTDINTVVIFESDDYNTFEEECYRQSELLDVVNNEEFANQVPEHGYETGDTKSNVELWWECADEDVKREVIEKRSKSTSENHYAHGECRDEIYKKISDKNKVSNKAFYDSLTVDEFKKHTDVQRQKWKECYSTLTDEEKQLRSKNISNHMKNREVSDETCQRIRDAKLNRTAEEKERTANLVRESFKTSAKRAEYELRMKKERLGAKNPSAKSISIDGKIYGSIKDAVDALELTRSVINNRLKSDKYPTWKRI